MNKLSKNFFLISFIPAIAYWYLEARYPLRIALAGGLILAIIELLGEWVFTKKLHTLSKFNFFVIAFLGGISLCGEDGIWFKLQPFFSGVGIGGFLIYKLWRADGLMIEMMEDMKITPKVPPWLIRDMEVHLTFLFTLYGVFMGVVAMWFSTDWWLFFKTAGFYLTFAVFFVFELFIMRLKLKNHIKRIEKLRATASA